MLNEIWKQFGKKEDKNMTPQEAYNKGLDDAENAVVVKFSNALSGNDDGPFGNPQVEEIRQKVLTMKPTVISDKDYNFIVDFLNDKDIDVDVMSDIDLSILEILTYCKEVIVGKKPRSRIATKTKDFLTKLEVDIIQNRDKLE